MVIKNLELQINSWPIKWWLIRVNQDGQRPKGTHPSLCSSVYLSLQNPLSFVLSNHTGAKSTIRKPRGDSSLAVLKPLLFWGLNPIGPCFQCQSSSNACAN